MTSENLKGGLILVTGSTGFVGSLLAGELIRLGYGVRVLASK